MYFEKCKKDSFGMIRIYMRKLEMTQFKVCVRVGGRMLRHNRIVTHGAPRETSAIINYYRFPPWPVLTALNSYRLCSTLI